MPKVKFDFNLPEESEDFEVYRSSVHYYCAINDLFSEIRSYVKWEKSKFIDESYDIGDRKYQDLNEKEKDAYCMGVADIRDYFLDILKEKKCYLGD
jgi:hypothetical protein